MLVDLRQCSALHWPEICKLNVYGDSENMTHVLGRTALLTQSMGVLAISLNVRNVSSEETCLGSRWHPA